MYEARRQSYPSRAWILIPLLGAVVVLGIAAALFFHGPPAVGVFPWYGWWFPLPWIFIPLIFLAFFSIRWFLWGGWRGGLYYRWYNDPAIEIVKQRFARGEITKDQFDQMVKDLGGY